MKNSNHFLIVFIFFLGAACNDEAFLEVAEPQVQTCIENYNELGKVNIDKIGKTTYVYEIIDGEKKLVEKFIGSSYATLFYNYQDGRLHSIKRYDRLSETFTDYEEFVYSNGILVRKNHGAIYKDNIVESFSFFSIYERDEQNRLTKRKGYLVEGGIEKLVDDSVFEWDDCNMIKFMAFDSEGNLNYSNSFFYDDKVNPQKLSTIPQTDINVSANNLIRIESNDNGEPSLNPETIEYFYTYNELGLPIQKRFNEFDKVDYYYTID